MKQAEMKVDPRQDELRANELFTSTRAGLMKCYLRRYRGEAYILPVSWRDDFPFDAVGFGGRTESMSRKEWRRRVLNNLRGAWQRVKREAAKAA